MARTPLTTILLAQNNYAIQPGDLAVTPASDFTNGNYFILTGNEILLVQNTDSVAHNFTALSTLDHLGRSSDLVYLVPAGGIAAIQFSVLEGWIQADGSVALNPSNVHILFTVLRIG
jgi:hypothetical protein